MPDTSSPALNKLSKDSGLAGRERARLVSEANLNDALFFHYNPSEWTDGYSADWGVEGESPAGAALPILTYKGGKDRNIKFELFLNEFGQKDRVRQTVDEALQWLFRHMSPTGESTQEGVESATPPVVLLLRGSRPAVRCVILSISIKEQLFEPSSQRPIRATVEVNLAQYIDTPEELRETVGGPTTSGDPRLASQQKDSLWDTAFEQGYKAGT